MLCPQVLLDTVAQEEEEALAFIHTSLGEKFVLRKLAQVATLRLVLAPPPPPSLVFPSPMHPVTAITTIIRDSYPYHIYSSLALQPRVCPHS